MPKRNKDQSGGAGKALRYLRTRGIREFASHAAEKVRDSRFDYQQWIRLQEPSPAQKGYQKKLRFRLMPEVAVMILRPKEEKEADGRTLESVRGQTYRAVTVSDILTSRIRDDAFILCVRNRDILTADAVYRMVEALQQGADAVYADADSYEISAGKKSFGMPLFKPDYNPEYLHSCNYIRTPFLVRASLARSLYRDGSMQAAGAWSAWNLSDDALYYDFILRCCSRAAQGGGIAHVARILCHAQRRSGSGERDWFAPASAKYAEDTEALRMVLEKEIAGSGFPAKVEDGPLSGTFRAVYEVNAQPPVSIVIPNKDNYSVLENCIWSIRSRSSYCNYEILVVENNSVEERTFACYAKLEEEGSARVIRYPQPFHFSRVVNEGVRQARGEYVILMNNDVTVLTPDWIERLLGHCQRPGIGAAGPKLLYPDRSVQSAGIVAGLMGFAGSMMVLEDGEDPGYMGRACLTQNMSALTAACMMVRRSVYREAGGFADDLPVALNDVDFCLKLVQAGYRNVLEPAAVMIHHESLSRGAEDTPDRKRRFEKEKAVFRKRWAGFLRDGDPAYNPNLSRRKCDWSQQT